MKITVRPSKQLGTCAGHHGIGSDAPTGLCLVSIGMVLYLFIVRINENHASNDVHFIALVISFHLNHLLANQELHNNTVFEAGHVQLRLAGSLRPESLQHD